MRPVSLINVDWIHAYYGERAMCFEIPSQDIVAAHNAYCLLLLQVETPNDWNPLRCRYQRITETGAGLDKNPPPYSKIFGAMMSCQSFVVLLGRQVCVLVHPAKPV